MIQKIMAVLQLQHERPTNYGWFHLTFVALTIIATILSCIFLRKSGEKQFRKTIFICWLIVALFELYKQIVFSYSADNGWSYDWHTLPFQLCSMSLYVLPIVAFAKESAFRDGALIFTSTFVFFGGLCVYVFPNDVFATNLLGVQIQTMVHHGVQLLTGVLVFVRYREKFKVLKNWLITLAFFAVCVGIAMALNLVIYNLFNQPFINMFFISPYYACTLPVLSSIYVAVPYIVFLLIYFLGFMLCAGVVYAVMAGVYLAVNKLSNLSKRN